MTAYDDAAKGVAGASAKLAEQSPPDAASARLRDQIAPLVQSTAGELGDAAAADDDKALRAAVAGLDDVANKLEDVIEAHR